MNAVPLETPKEAARRLAARVVAKGYQPQALHEYHEASGEPAYWRIRCKHPQTGEKWIRPMRREGVGYAIGEPRTPDGGKLLYRLPDVLAAPPESTVWVVEGENCADALAAAEVVATTSGSASSADGADWTPLRGRRVILWPDNDEAGAKYAAGVAERLAALGCDVRTVDVASLDLPTGGDAVDWLEKNPPSDLAGLPLNGVLSVLSVRTEALPEPLPPVPTFDMDLLPQEVRDWCEDAADGLQVPADFTAIPAMVGLAGAIGRSVAVSLRQNGHWFEVPVLWGCVVGRPSSGKSPALSPVRRMLDRLASSEREAYEAELRAYEARAMVAKASKANATDAIRKALKRGNKLEAEAAAEEATFDEEPPGEPRIVVNDATVEKLGELLNQNPRGLVQFRDELAGWLANLDREGREADRAFWLECWNGQGGFTVDRIGRGTVRIEACAAWNLGGMQPGKLDEYVRGAVRGGFADDGLMQRFQLAVYPDMPASWRYTDRAPDPAAEARVWETFKRLRAMQPADVRAVSSPACVLPYLPLDANAQELFKVWQTELMVRLRGGSEPGFMESHLAKYPALAGRLALVLHLADGGAGPIPAESMARALGWCDYLEGHARRIYAPATDGGLMAAHALLKKRKDMDGQFTARDVYRKGWAGLTDPDVVSEAIDTLIEHGHLDFERPQTGGRPSTVFTWRAA